MYNLRYHIASLVGVFLALALGLILGGLVVQRGTVERQQGALVEGLQREFAQLRDENRELSDSNDALSAYAKHLTEEWSAGRLDDRTIIIFSASTDEGEVRDVTDAVRSAGGVVATVELLKPRFGLDDPDIASDIASLAGDPAAPLESLASQLAAEWTSAAVERPVTDALVSRDVLRVDGLESGVLAAGLVDVALDAEVADPAGIAIAAALPPTIPAVVAEAAGSESGLAAAANEVRVSALDTLGTDIGRYTLVALLTGYAPGYYGAGDDAVAPFPSK